MDRKKQFSGYDKRFSEKEVKELKEEFISAEEANGYNYRFCGSDIIPLAKNGIISKIAESYNSRFDGLELMFLITHGISPQISRSYGGFGGVEISHFVEKNISPEIAARYNASNGHKRFDGMDICSLFEAGISPEQAWSYDKTLVSSEIVDLVKAGITPQQIKPYPKKFRGLCAELIPKDISLEKVKEYDPRLFFELEHLIKAEVPPQEANKYDQTFSGCYIAELYQLGCSSKQANRFAKRFTQESRGLEVLYLVRAGCSIEEVAAYNPRFSGYDIVSLKKYKVPPTIAEKYPQEFYGKLIGELFELGVSPDDRRLLPDRRFNAVCRTAFIRIGLSLEEARKYDTRLFGLSIARLIKKGKDPRKAEQYNPRFKSSIQLEELITAGVPPELANSYYTGFGGERIAWLYTLGITPDNTSLKKQKRLFLPLSNLQRITNYKPENFLRLGQGNHAMVLLNKEKQTAYKVSANRLNEEIFLLKKLNTVNGRARNIINIKREIQRGLIEVIELEYLQGKTFSQIFDEEKTTFNGSATIKYARDIFHGLTELKAVGIWHRDIWLGNIVLEELQDRAIILDLGSATMNHVDGPKDNRRYGGENDLQSLGQIIYKMITGHHLFNPTINTSTRFIPKKIKQERERIYADPFSLEIRLNQVETNVPDRNVAEIIRLCLTAKGTDEDYQTLEARFKEYGA